MKRFPPPWTVEAIDGGFKIVDANKQTLAYVYGHADKRDAETAKGLTLDEARRPAVMPCLILLRQNRSTFLARCGDDAA